MTAENLETVSRIYDGWERGDFTVGVDLFDEDAVLVLDGEMPDAGEYTGPDQIRGYMKGFLEAWDSLTIAAESVEDLGDGVLVKVRQSGVGRDSGAAVAFSYFQLWRFEGGRVVRLESILHEQRALDAAGLSGR
jgi:ketosteroid isomerase-like protein